MSYFCYFIIQNKDQDLEAKVLDFMNSARTACKSLAIAKGVGLSRAASVNTVLYSLEKEGIVKKLPGKPPTWELKHGAISDTESGEDPGPQEGAGMLRPNYVLLTLSSYL